MTWLRMPIGVAVVVLVSATNSAAAVAQPPGVQIPGTVESVADDAVTLESGETLALTEQTRVTLIEPVTATDLVAGQYVAIAARRAADGALEASVVTPFPEAARGTGEGQREMTELRFCEPLCEPGDLMTNANIDEARLEAVDSGQLTISFLGETGQVRVTAETRVYVQSAGSLADVVPGATVIGFVNPQGAAGLVWVYLE